MNVPWWDLISAHVAFAKNCGHLARRRWRPKWPASASGSSNVKLSKCIGGLGRTCNLGFWSRYSPLFGAYFTCRPFGDDYPNWSMLNSSIFFLTVTCYSKFFSAEATNKFSVACLKQRLMATWRLCFQRCVYIWMSPCRFHINVFQECKGLVGYNVGTPFANEDNQVAETPLSCHHCWGKVWTLASRRS